MKRLLSTFPIGVKSNFHLTMPKKLSKRHFFLRFWNTSWCHLTLLVSKENTNLYIILDDAFNAILKINHFLTSVDDESSRLYHSSWLTIIPFAISTLLHNLHRLVHKALQKVTRIHTRKICIFSSYLYFSSFQILLQRRR